MKNIKDKKNIAIKKKDMKMYYKENRKK